jgi:hypothetical protein
MSLPAQGEHYTQLAWRDAAEEIAARRDVRADFVGVVEWVVFQAKADPQSAAKWIGTPK